LVPRLRNTVKESLVVRFIWICLVCVVDGHGAG
jgi:hypothetical protein